MTWKAEGQDRDKVKIDEGFGKMGSCKREFFGGFMLSVRFGFVLVRVEGSCEIAEENWDF